MRAATVANGFTKYRRVRQLIKTNERTVFVSAKLMMLLSSSKTTLERKKVVEIALRCLN